MVVGMYLNSILVTYATVISKMIGITQFYEIMM